MIFYQIILLILCGIIITIHSSQVVISGGVDNLYIWKGTVKFKVDADSIADLLINDPFSGEEFFQMGQNLIDKIQDALPRGYCFHNALRIYQFPDADKIRAENYANLIKRIQQHPQFNRVVSSTKHYADILANEWQIALPRITTLFSSLRIPSKHITAYIAPPWFEKAYWDYNGVVLISQSSTPTHPCAVAIAHEYLHDALPYIFIENEFQRDIRHAIIELATDFELQSQLGSPTHDMDIYIYMKFARYCRKNGMFSLKTHQLVLKISFVIVKQIYQTELYESSFIILV